MQKIAKSDAISIVRHLKKTLQSEGVPVQRVLLFGSFAKDRTHDWSDIDVAVVHGPFLATRGKEKSHLFERGKDVDVRIELLSFHPSDIENRYSSIAQEIQSHGVEII